MSKAPKYVKTILCLANSRRPGGRCVAGKEFAGGKTGAWIRPVDPQNDNAISEQESLYKDGASADLLDIVTIPMTEPKPQHYHTENHQIDPGFYWAKQGRAT
jgi:hypothetical protein